jgi:sugar phosphate isomerase/epimerase
VEKWPLGVFISVDAGLGLKLDVARELGLPTIQMHAPHGESRTAENAQVLVDKLASFGITATAMFGGFEGESYADIPTVVQTVGLVPLATRAARVAEMKEISDFAKLMNIEVVALHLGFVPEETTDPGYAEIVELTRDLCDHAASNGQRLHLETGQETAEGLLQFVGDVERDNLRINFDPANMILYGAGEPIEALKKLGSLVSSVHCKDAKWAANPGQEWGEEVPLGEGDVGMEAYLRMLDEIGYTGPLTVEREIPEEPDRQRAEIGHALGVLSQLKEKIG